MAPLTLMAVHAHPDDESTFTGGTIARYTDEGIRVVVVLCTNGDCGREGDDPPFAPSGVKATSLATVRRLEFEVACAELSVHAVEHLGYRDSGMMGWPENDAPGCFWRASPTEAVSKLERLLDRYAPQVVVTYDEDGFYGHPDHIMANRATCAAVDRSASVRKLYYTVISRSAVVRYARRLRELGATLPAPFGQLDPANPPFGTPDERVDAVIDVSRYAAKKRTAMAAYRSQSDNAFFLSSPPQAFSFAFGEESYIRVVDRTTSPLRETDLFAGLRPTPSS